MYIYIYSIHTYIHNVLRVHCLVMDFSSQDFYKVWQSFLVMPSNTFLALRVLATSRKWWTTAWIILAKPPEPSRLAEVGARSHFCQTESRPFGFVSLCIWLTFPSKKVIIIWSDTDHWDPLGKNKEHQGSTYHLILLQDCHLIDLKPSKPKLQDTWPFHGL